VELKGVLGLEASAGKDPEGLKNDNDTRGVVIGTGATGSGRAAGRVVVGGDNDWEISLIGLWQWAGQRDKK